MRSPPQIELSWRRKRFHNLAEAVQPKYSHNKDFLRLTIIKRFQKPYERFASKIEKSGGRPPTHR